LEAATGEAIAVIDGDGQMPADDVLAVYDALRRGSYDLVQTYRTKRFDGWKRRVLSRTYNRIFRLLYPGVGVHDVNSKPKIFTRTALEQLSLTSDGWFVDAEILIRARAKGLRIGEVPTVFYSNQRRASFVRLSAILEFVRELVRYRFIRRG
jgi:glycosyltransferase involved in cell wall biosynthesis